MAENPLAQEIVIYDGISFAPWDIIKGLAIGLATYGISDWIGITFKDDADAIKKGFVVGGVIGGLEELLDAAFSVMLGTRWGCGTGTMEGIIHELFQSVFLNGLISGLAVVALRKILG